MQKQRNIKNFTNHWFLLFKKRFSKMFTYFLSQRASSLFSCCILSKLTSEHILRVTKLCLQVDSLPLRRWIAPYKINCVVSTLITLDTPIWNHISKFEVETVSKSITVHMIVSAFCASYAFQLFVDIHKYSTFWEVFGQVKPLYKGTISTDRVCMLLNIIFNAELFRQHVI